MKELQKRLLSIAITLALVVLAIALGRMLWVSCLLYTSDAADE